MTHPNIFVTVDHCAPCSFKEFYEVNTAPDVGQPDTEDFDRVRALKLGVSTYVGFCEVQRVPDPENVPYCEEVKKKLDAMQEGQKVTLALSKPKDTFIKGEISSKWSTQCALIVGEDIKGYCTKGTTRWIDYGFILDVE